MTKTFTSTWTWHLSSLGVRLDKLLLLLRLFIYEWNRPRWWWNLIRYEAAREEFGRRYREGLYAIRRGMIDTYLKYLGGAAPPVTELHDALDALLPRLPRVHYHNTGKEVELPKDTMTGTELKEFLRVPEDEALFTLDDVGDGNDQEKTTLIADDSMWRFQGTTCLESTKLGTGWLEVPRKLET